MLNFSSISNNSGLGKALRLPLKLVPRNARLPILQGPLRGYWWIAASANHGCWLGSYELEKQLAFASHIRHGAVIYDVGANVGFYTLLASEKAGSSGEVHAFEPLPENLSFLWRHVRLNRLSNVAVHAAAVSDVAGKLRFSRTGSRSTGHLDDRGEMQVGAVTLDQFVFEQGHAPPSLVKIDVEGAEGRVLRGAQRLLHSKRPVIFLATHGKQAHQECCEFLLSMAYQVEGVTGEPDGPTDELVCFPRAS